MSQKDMHLRFKFIKFVMANF